MSIKEIRSSNGKLSPIDIKNLNDNLKHLDSTINYKIDKINLEFDKKHGIDILSKDLRESMQRANSLFSKINANKENLIQYKLESDKNINELVESVNKVAGELGVFKIETDRMLATKVSTDVFESYQIQTDNVLASKVSGENFESYVEQTNKRIDSKVATKDFESYQIQTNKELSSMVKALDFETYQTQTAELIGSKVNNKEFESYKTQTANEISSKVSSGTFESYITQTDKNIGLVVNSNGTVNADSIVSAINLGSKKISISALDIDLNGLVTFNDLSSPGATTINGSNIKSGTIEGITIKTAPSDLVVNSRIEMSTSGLLKFYGMEPQYQPTVIQSNGDVGITISGGSVDIDTSLKVNNSTVLTASNWSNYISIPSTNVPSIYGSGSACSPSGSGIFMTIGSLYFEHAPDGRCILHVDSSHYVSISSSVCTWNAY